MTGITSVSVASLDQWAKAYSATPARTYFQSPEWTDIWQSYFGRRLRPVPLYVTFDDGSEAVVPLIELKRRTHAHPLVLSSPVGTYGGILGDARIGTQHANLVVEHLHGYEGLTWTASPFGVQPQSDVLDRTDSASVIDLASGTEPVWAAMSKGHRSAVSKARRSGVVVRRAGSETDWRAYFGLYGLSIARWGRNATSRYGWRLFELLRARESDVTLWLAEAERVPIAGAVLVRSGVHVGYWHGAAADSAFPLRPVHLLLWSAIEDAASSGVRWFDMLPSGGHEGVAAFKRSFGARPMAVAQLRTPAAREGALGRAWGATMTLLRGAR